MAALVDNLTYLSSYTPFERPPEFKTLSSLIPRGLRRFYFEGDLTDKGAGDTLQALLTLTLPDSFAYSISRFDLVLEDARATDWRGQCLLFLLNHIPGQPLGSRQDMNLVFDFGSFPSPMRNANTTGGVLSQFISPMWSTHSGEITFRANIYNPSATAATTQNLRSHVEFYEYDLVQAQRYFVNTPIPVRV